MYACSQSTDTRLEVLFHFYDLDSNYDISSTSSKVTYITPSTSKFSDCFDVLTMSSDPNKINTVLTDDTGSPYFCNVDSSTTLLSCSKIDYSLISNGGEFVII